MEKTISINLGGALFYAEEDAYTRLDSYLREVEHYFNARGDDSAEILRDIETSLAEQFTTAGAGDLRRAVTLPEVEAALKNMGTINDFSAEEKAESTESRLESDQPRRFYRDSEHAVIGGVCAGLGHYFGVDPVWVRVLFALSLFLWGFGVVIYFVLWVAAPEAKTTAEKLTMQGEAVNLSSLSAKLKENLQSEKLKRTGSEAADVFSRFFNRLFNLIGRIISGFGPLIRIAFGIVLGMIALAGFTGISLAGVIAAFSGQQYFDPGFVSVIGWQFPWLVMSLTIVFALPFLAFFFLAISVLRKKNWVPTVLWLALLLIWFGSLMGAGALGSDTFARVRPYVLETRRESIALEGKLQVITLDAPYYLTIITGPQLALKAEGHPADLSRLETSLVDGQLVINNRHLRDQICINCGRSIKLTLVTPTPLDKVIVKDGGVLNMENWQADNLALEFKDHSGGNLGLNVKNLDLKANDFVDLDFLSGQIDRITANVEGWSRVDTGATKIKEAVVTLGESAQVSVRVSDKLKVLLLPDSLGARLFYNPDLKNIEADTATRLQLRFLGQEDDIDNDWRIDNSDQDINVNVNFQ